MFIPFYTYILNLHYRLQAAINGMFMRGLQKAMELALTTLEHSTTHME